MKKHYLIILEIIIVLIAGGLYFIKEVLPSAREKFPLKNIISPKKYKGMVEFQIDNSIDFAVVFNQESIIYHIFYFDSLSTSVNQKKVLQSSSLKDEVYSIIQSLYDSYLIRSDSSIVLTTYDSIPKNFSSIVRDELKNFHIFSEITEKKSTLKEKINFLQLENVSDEYLLYELDYYSMNFISSSNDTTFVFDEDYSKKLSDSVYLKLEKYVVEHHIQELDQNQKEFTIQMISGDENDIFFPDSNSWFYVKEGNIYSYIEFKSHDNTYGYCYQGAIDLKRKGEC